MKIILTILKIIIGLMLMFFLGVSPPVAAWIIIIGLIIFLMSKCN